MNDAVQPLHRRRDRLGVAEPLLDNVLQRLDDLLRADAVWIVIELCDVAQNRLISIEYAFWSILISSLALSPFSC